MIETEGHLLELDKFESPGFNTADCQWQLLAVGPILLTAAISEGPRGGRELEKEGWAGFLDKKLLQVKPREDSEASK